MINVNGLNKSFDGFSALNDLSLHVKKGSVYGLVGPNGAGKTTILKILAGIYRHDSGTCEINGQNVSEKNKTRNKLVFISDDVFFYSTYSVLDMAKYYSEIYTGWNWERFKNLENIFKIDTSKRACRLSKGMQKQVAFWIAVSAMPDLILLDEPVDGLDPVMRRNVWKILLTDVAERGTTILISSHNLRELEDVCDHVGIMHNGKIVLEKELDDLKGNINKYQVAFEGSVPAELLDELKPLHTENYGSVNILIIKGNSAEISGKIKNYSPIIMDILPLSLEEVFIYELGGIGYEFKDIIL